MKIDTFDRSNVRLLMLAFEAEMQKVSEKLTKDFGVKVKVNGCRFGSTDCKPRVSIVVDGGEKRSWDANAAFYGLKPEWFGQKITLGLSEFKISGFDRRKRVSPVLIERIPDGKKFKTSVAQVIRCFGPVAPRVAFVPR